MKIIISIYIGFLLLACGGKTYERENPLIDPKENSEFRELKSYFIDSLCAIRPDLAGELGLFHCDTMLLMPNEENRLKTLAFAKSFLDSLATFNFKQLSRINQIDYNRIKAFANSSIIRIEKAKDWQWNPALYDLKSFYADILHNTKLPIEERMRLIHQGLGQTPEYYVQAKMNLFRPSEQHLLLAIDTLNDGLSAVWEEIKDSLELLDESSFSVDSFNNRYQLAKISLRDYIGWMEKDVLPNLDTGNSRDFRLGKELYDDLFEYETHSTYGAKEMYSKALKEKFEITEKMFQIADSLWPKYFGILKKPQDDKLKLLATMVDTIRKNRDTIVFYGKSPEELMMDMKEFAEDNDLMAEGFFPSEAEEINWKLDSTESKFRNLLELNSSLTNHFYSSQSQKTSLKPIIYSPTTKGWSLYMLKMLLEEGYAEQSLEMWLMFYHEYLQILSKPILDYSIHVYGLNREESVDLLIHEIFMDPKEVDDIWKEIISQPIVTGSYFTAYYEISKLKEEMKSRLGDDFDLEEFHEQFLSYGDIPVKYIQLQMLENSSP